MTARRARQCRSSLAASHHETCDATRKGVGCALLDAEPTVQAEWTPHALPADADPADRRRAIRGTGRGLALQEDSPAPGRGRNGGGHHPRTVPARLGRARCVRSAFPAGEPRLPQHTEPGRAALLHVPGRNRVRPKASARARPRGRGDQSRQHHRALLPRCGAGALLLPAPLRRQRLLHRVRPVHGRGDEHHRLPGARPHSDRAQPPAHEGRRAHHRVRRRGRRHRVDHSGRGGCHRPRQRGRDPALGHPRRNGRLRGAHGAGGAPGTRLARVVLPQPGGD